MKTSDYEAMGYEELRKLYKAKCAAFRDMNNEVADIRAVLHAKLEVADAERDLAAVKAKHATNAAKGGGL